MIIQIDGYYGSGKGVLSALLDGHPNIFVAPIHDFSQCAFLTESNSKDWVATKHIEILRKALSRTQYYMLEKLHWDKFHTFPFSSDVQIKLPYDLDFYGADKTFITSLIDKREWYLEDIVDELYSSIMRYSKSKLDFTGVSKFVSMNNIMFFEYYENIPIVFPNSKNIQVRRSVEEIIAVRSNRKPRPEDFKTKRNYAENFNQRIERGEVEKILSFHDESDKLINEYPEKFMKVEFDDLIYRTRDTMISIADFLEIPLSEQLFIASYNGVELEYGGIKYIGQTNDRVEDLLTQEEREIITERISSYYK